MVSERAGMSTGMALGGRQAGSFRMVVVLIVWALCVGMGLGAPLRRKHWTSDVGSHAQCLTRITEEDRVEVERGLERLRMRLGLIAQADSVLARDMNSTDSAPPASGPVLPSSYVFNVSFNIVYRNETPSEGYVDDDRINEQMKVLNADYKKANISFVLVKTTRIHNPDWFNGTYPGSQQEQAMTKAHHIGDARTLNVYSVTFNSTTKSLGSSSIPSKYKSDPTRDGILIRHSTISRGSRTNFNIGRTLTHEVGHWLGLYHTFEGGCDDGVGDRVADTPPQSSGSEGCPVGRDSCEGGGPDLINNFMDYSYDACMDSFTAGQIRRMHESIAAFRVGTGAE